MNTLLQIACVSRRPLFTLFPPKEQTDCVHILPLPVLEPIYLSMANVIEHVRQSGLTPPDSPPSSLVVFGPVQCQRGSYHELHLVANAAWVQLRIDVQRKGGIGGGGGTEYSGHAVIFLRVEGGEGKGILKEL